MADDAESGNHASTLAGVHSPVASTCLCSTHAGHAIEVVITMLVILVAIVSVTIAIVRTRRVRRQSEAREH